MTLLAFVDIETTGLDPAVHEPWEVALVLRDTDAADSDRQHVWQLPVDLGRADPVALTVSGYYERAAVDSLMEPWRFAGEFARLTHGAHLVGAVPSFDAGFLGPYLRRNGACPGWHYHLVDSEALAAGWLGWQPPWNSTALSIAVGVDPARFARHSAMGDVEWAMAMFDAVMEMKR